MSLNTYPCNPFPPSTDQMDADTLEANVSKLESDVDQLKIGLTNKQDKTDNTLTTTDKTVVGAINEVANGLMNISGIYSNQKSTRSDSGDVVFATTASRYSGVLLITGNNAKFAAYFVAAYHGGAYIASKISGDDFTVTVNSTDDTVSVALPGWSRATLITDTAFS